MSDPGPVSYADPARTAQVVLGLQRTLGNSYVQRLIVQAARPRVEPARGLLSAQQKVIADQGSHDPRPARAIQAERARKESADRLGREADAGAERVTGTGDPPMRCRASLEEDDGAQVARVLQAGRAPASALLGQHVARKAAGAGVPAAVASPVFTITIVEAGATRLTDIARQAARTAVAAELKAVAAGSKKASVRAGFAVGYRRSLSAQEARGFGPTNFVLYVLPARDSSRALELAKRHVTIDPAQEAATLRKISEQLKAEGGACVVVGQRGVSFVASEIFERLLSSGPMTEEERKTLEEQVGQKMAELMLHELGHAMGAQHGKGIMAPTLDITPGSEAKHFTPGSKRQIRQRLEVVQLKRNVVQRQKKEQERSPSALWVEDPRTKQKFPLSQDEYGKNYVDFNLKDAVYFLGPFAKTHPRYRKFWVNYDDGRKLDFSWGEVGDVADRIVPLRRAQPPQKPGSRRATFVPSREVIFVKRDGFIYPRVFSEATTPNLIDLASSIRYNQILKEKFHEVAAVVEQYLPILASYVGGGEVERAAARVTARGMKGAASGKLWTRINNFIRVLFDRLQVARSVRAARGLVKRGIPGASRLLKRLNEEAARLKEAIKAVDAAKTREVLDRLLGLVREVQVGSKLEKAGEKLERLGMVIKEGGRIVTEIDSVTREAGRLFLNQVKRGTRALLRPGSSKWAEFTRQADETVRAAQRMAAEQKARAVVRYFVDRISPEARAYLEAKGIIIRVLGR